VATISQVFKNFIPTIREHLAVASGRIPGNPIDIQWF
jgi:hypothetical protein